MLNLDYRDTRPIYAQIVDNIRQQIQAGVMAGSGWQLSHLAAVRFRGRTPRDTTNQKRSATGTKPRCDSCAAYGQLGQ